MMTATTYTIKNYTVTNLGSLKKIEIDGDPNKTLMVNSLRILPAKNKSISDIQISLIRTLGKLTATIVDPNVVIEKPKKEHITGMDNLVK